MITSSPGIDQRLRQIEDHVLAAHADDALGRFVVGAEILSVALAHRLLQLDRAAGAGVLGEVLLDRPDGGLLDVVRRREIGLAGAEIHHVDALRAQFLRVGRHLHGGGNADRRDAVCDFCFKFQCHVFLS